MQWNLKWTVPVAGLVVSAAALSGAAFDATASAPKEPQVPAYVTKAVTDPARSKDAQDDARRKGAALVAFTGVKPGDKVLELVPGGGYFTRIFSRVVGEQGHVYASIPAPMEKYSDETKELPKELANVSLLEQAADALSTPEPVDVAFTSQNYHDYPDKFMGPTDPAILNKAVFAALKPGGTYVVVDHVAADGSGLRDTDTLHRIDPATVKQQVEAAGFEYVGALDVLRNPKDDHTLTVFDKSIRGHTDQFVYKFRKPMAEAKMKTPSHAH